MTREEMLGEAKRCVCGEREEQYGTPEDCFETIAALWGTYLRSCCVEKGVDVCILGADVAAMMALLKIARIANGQEKADNWVDLAGYAACGCELETRG